MLIMILTGIILAELFYWFIIRPYESAYYKIDRITQEQVVYLIVNGNFRFKELERHKNEKDFDYRKRIERLYKLQKESEKISNANI